MDGITLNAPYSERERVNTQLSIFDFVDNDEISEKEQFHAKYMIGEQIQV